MSAEKRYCLAINPGATSTKASVYDGVTEVFTENIKHPIEEIKQFAEIADQFDYRKNTILDMLKKHNIDISVYPNGNFEDLKKWIEQL